VLFLPGFALATSGTRQRLRGGFLTAFGASHTLHLAGIVAYASLLWPEFAHEFPPAVLLTASTFFAWVFFAAGNGLLTWLGRRPLGPRWAAATAEYFVFGVFAIDFGSKVARQPLVYAPFLALALGAIGIRVAARRARPLASHAASA
jgi:hypothetical protein